MVIIISHKEEMTSHIKVICKIKCPMMLSKG